MYGTKVSSLSWANCVKAAITPTVGGQLALVDDD